MRIKIVRMYHIIHLKYYSLGNQNSPHVPIIYNTLTKVAVDQMSIKINILSDFSTKTNTQKPKTYVVGAH